MPTPTLYMALPNPTVGGDPGTWANEIVSSFISLDTLAVSAVPVTITTTGSLAVYNGTALIKVDATGGAVVLTLPDATPAANKGRRYEVVKIDSSVNSVTLQGFGGQTISGNVSLVWNTRWDGFRVESDGANWIITGFAISGTLAKSQLPATTVYTDQTNTFGLFVQTFRSGADFVLSDPVSATKTAIFDLSNITMGFQRTVNVPDAASTTVQPSTAPANQFATAISAQGVVAYTQPSFANLSGSISLAQTPLTTLGDTLYVNATPALARLAGNITTVKQYLSQTGTGAVSAAPVWAQIDAADLSNGVTGSGAIVLATGPTISGPTISGTISVSGTLSFSTVNPTFFSQTGSGAVVLAVSPSITGTVSLATVTISGKITNYNSTATVAGGVPAIYALYDATAQGAAIVGASLLASTPFTGQYRVSWSAIVTQAATTSSILGGATGFQVSFTDFDTNASATTQSAASATAYVQTNASNTVGSQVNGSAVVNAKTGTALTFSFDWTNVGGTPMQYAIHVKVEFLG